MSQNTTLLVFFRRGVCQQLLAKAKEAFAMTNAYESGYPWFLIHHLPASQAASLQAHSYTEILPVVPLTNTRCTHVNPMHTFQQALSTGPWQQFVLHARPTAMQSLQPAVSPADFLPNPHILSRTIT